MLAEQPKLIWFEMVYWLKFIIHTTHTNKNIEKSIRTTITRWQRRVQAIYNNKSWAWIIFFLQWVLNRLFSTGIQSFFIMLVTDHSQFDTLFSPLLLLFCLINTKYSFLFACIVFIITFPFSSDCRLIEVGMIRESGGTKYPIQQYQNNQWPLKL